MSDEPNTSEEVAGPTPPAVIMGPTEDDQIVGVMHKGGVIRPFLADTHSIMERIESIGVAEFGMSQDDARAHAAASVGAPPGPKHDALLDAHQEIELLRAELGRAYSVIADMAQAAKVVAPPVAEPEPPPPPTLAPDPPPPPPPEPVPIANELQIGEGDQAGM